MRKLESGEVVLQVVQENWQEVDAAISLEAPGDRLRQETEC